MERFSVKLPRGEIVIKYSHDGYMYVGSVELNACGKGYGKIIEFHDACSAALEISNALREIAEKENEMPSVFQEVVYHDVFYMPLQNGFSGRFIVNVAKVEGGYYGDIICSAFLDGKRIPQTATSCAAYGKSKMGVVSRLQECIPGMIPKTADAIKESHEAGYW